MLKLLFELEGNVLDNEELIKTLNGGAQWFSGRVLDSRPKRRGFQPHQCHCVVSLNKTH